MHLVTGTRPAALGLPNPNHVSPTGVQTLQEPGQWSLWLDAAGNCLAQGEAVRQWMHWPDPAAATRLCLRAGRLLAPGAQAALDAALRAGLDGRTTALALPYAPGNIQDDWPVSLLVRPGRLTHDDATRVQVIVHDPATVDLCPQALQSLFRLTPSEARVTQRLAAGQDVPTIASALGVQRNTVQSHVKQVLLKTGTSRQAALVALVLRSAARRCHWTPGGGALASARQAPSPRTESPPKAHQVGAA